MMKYQCFTNVKIVFLSLFVMLLFVPPSHAQEEAACYINTAGDYICPLGGGGGGGGNPLLDAGSLSGTSILGSGSPLTSGLGSSLTSGLQGLLSGILDCLPISMQNSMMQEMTGLIGQDSAPAELQAIADKYSEICDLIGGLTGMVCGALGDALPDFSSYAIDSIAADMSIFGSSFDITSVASDICGGRSHGGEPGEATLNDTNCSADGPDITGVSGEGGERIAAVARAMEGYSTACVAGTDNGSLACAWVVSTILQEAGYGLDGGTTLGTVELRQWLLDDPCYDEVDTGTLTSEDAVNLQPGDILVTPTNFDTSGASGACRSSYSGRCNSGHTGIYVGNGGIVSNGSKGFAGPAAGVSENYTVDSWESVTNRNTAQSSVFRRNESCY